MSCSVFRALLTMRVMSCASVLLIFAFEKIVQRILGFSMVPRDFNLSPRSAFLKRVTVHNVSFSNVSSGVDHHQPAGLCTVSSKLKGEWLQFRWNRLLSGSWELRNILFQHGLLKRHLSVFSALALVVFFHFDHFSVAFQVLRDAFEEM